MGPLLLVAALWLGGCGGSPGAETPPRGRHVTWVIAGESLAALRTDNAGLARRFFDNRHTFVLGAPGGQNLVPPGYRSLPAVTYTSLEAFEGDLDRGAIAPRVAAVLYDPESWSATPPRERREPVPAMRRFIHLASSWGLGTMVAPGRDLALESGGECERRGGELLDAAYLRCRLPRAGAGADRLVVQAAPEELEPERMSALLGAARAQLAAGGGGPMLLATLSTDPPGNEEPIWPADLMRAARIDRAHGYGVMFNFSPTTASLAADFLRDLERAERRGGPEAG